jgi:hypothetical protein
MPVPVISSTQSVLSVAQWQDFSFTASATGLPVEWAISPSVPSGMIFFPATGILKGPPTIPGIFNFTLAARNADGWSAPQEFTLACSYFDGDNTKFHTAINIDIQSREVSGFPNLNNFIAKYGDDIVLRVSLQNSGSVLNLDLESLKFALKERDGDPVILSSTNWRKVSTGIQGTTYYLIYISVSGPVLAGILAEYEQDRETSLLGIAEIEWVQRNANDTVGPSYVRLTSDTFSMRVIRDLI